MEFTRVGDFCPDETCPDYEKFQSDQQRNIKKAGRTKKGCQRYQCKTSQQTFIETKGTIFHRHQTPEEEIIETLAFIQGTARFLSGSSGMAQQRQSVKTSKGSHRVKAVFEPV